ncbi:MAG: hypothetical protein HY900_04875 [Deltaproteobacteria bacterium]|nr:hypothetical protein [Deltaproteobacteria bacterium]
MDSGSRRVDPNGRQASVIAATPRDIGFLAKAIDAAGLGIIALEKDSGRVAYLNPAGAGMLRALSDSSGADALMAFAQVLLAQASPAGAGSGEAVSSLTFGERVIGYTLYPAHDELWAFFRDVTEKERLSSLAESLQLSDALLGVFTALRHDVGNSVNAAKTSLHVLRQGLGRHDETAVRRYVDRALEALAGVETVLGTLRDYGFASRPRLRPVPIGEVVECAVLECGSALAGRGAVLDVEVQEGAVQVLADPASLEAALCALVSRAELCGRAGGNPRILVLVEPRRDTVVVRISPRGDREALPVRPSDDDNLRLLVVRRLVAQMEASLELQGCDSVVTLRRVRGPG